MTHWIRFFHQDTAGFGTLEGAAVVEHEGDMFSDPRPTGRQFDASEVTLLIPVVPTKMVAMANNFHELIQKFGMTVPDDPLYFLKANSSFHPTGEPILRPPGYSGKIVFEGELGIVIGSRCSNATVDDAGHCIFGYTCVNDVTAIELLNKNPSFQQWTRCKAADTFGVFGPCVATGLDPRNLRVKTLVDGEERQDYPIPDMVFTPQELVSRVSHDMTLFAGDVIACGTSVGVGSLRPGNVVEIHIDGIGTLRNVFEG